MVEDQSVLCTILARGGSKSIPKKNIRELDGKPLITYTIEDARQWEMSTDVVVSTDSEEIAAVAEEEEVEVPFMRPDYLANDTAPRLAAIQHAHEEMERIKKTTFNYIVDLWVTAPLRSIEDIENCFRMVSETDAENAITVTEAKTNPYFNMLELNEDGFATLVKEPASDIDRRQDTPTVYETTCAVWVFERDFLCNADYHLGDRTKVSHMPQERSVDIDNPIDLAFAEFLLTRRDEIL